MKSNFIFAGLHPRRLFTAVFASMLLPLCIASQEIAQQAYLKSPNPSANQYFGYVAISGDTAVVRSSRGAYVFVRQGTDWSFQAALQFPNTYVYEVAISGDTIVIGTLVSGSLNSEYTNPGSVYVLVRNGTTWSQQARLRASNATPGDFFCHVAICGDTIVVGATEEDSNSVGVNGDQQNKNAPSSGAAYVFTRSGTNWTQQAYLKASNAEAGDVLGYSVAISGDTVVVGAPGEDSSATEVDGDQSNNGAPDSGAAYVFVREGTNWSQQAYLKAPTGVGPVAISGDTAVAGRYVFVRRGTAWSRQAYLQASNFEPGDDVGGWRNVAISGDFVVAGAIGEDSNATGINGNQADNSAPDSGAAYVFVRYGTNWIQEAYLKASNTGSGDWFGSMVAVSGDTIIVGAGSEDSNATLVNGDQNNNSTLDSGAAYIFAGFAPPCTNCPPSFTLQPASQLVLPGTNVTLTAAARGPTPIHYQWRFEGTNLLNATNATYSFTNVSLTNGHGSFSVVASNEFGSVTSTNAFVFVSIRPGIVTPPVTRTVLEGGNARFSCVATGAPPIYYRWSGAAIPRAFTNNTGVFVFTNALVSITNGVRCTPINAAGIGLGVSASLLVLADFDRDGMADVWETQHGFSTNDAADAMLDLDLDGMSNRDEFTSATNPLDASSVLQLVINRAGDIVLQFTAQSNLAYEVQFHADLAVSPWQTLSNVPPASSERIIQILDPDTVPAAGRFYRVRTPPGL
jgi:hypothetical protein